METKEELLAWVDKRIKHAYELLRTRQTTLSGKEITKQFQNTMDLFLSRAVRYRELFEKGPKINSLPYLLLQSDFEVVEEFMVFSPSNLARLYNEFHDRFEVYPDATAALDKRLDEVISREERLFKPARVDGLIDKIKGYKIKLAKLLEFAEQDTDLFSGAVQLLYQFIKETNAEILAYDNARKEHLRKLAIKPKPGEPTVGEVIAYAKRLQRYSGE
jgi:hypothetical protein